MSAPPLGNQTEPEGQIGATINLAYVVRNMQNELEDYSMQQYKRLLQLVIDGLGFLRIYHAGAIQVAYLQVNDAGIVQFPNDYISYSKIGWYCHGQLITLTLNSTMILNRATSCTEDIRTMEGEQGYGLINSLGDGYYFAPHYNNGQYYGALYGAGGGFNQAYYRVDDVARQIQFNGFIPNDKRIVMEYQSSGISAGTVIGREMLEPLKKYAHLYRVKYNPMVADSYKERLTTDLDTSILQLRAFKGKFTLQEFLDVLFRSHKQSPKV